MRVYQIFEQRVTGSMLGLDVGDTVTSRSGLTFRWAGGSWVVSDTGGNSSRRINQMANEVERETLTNRARAQKGLPPIEFENGRPKLDADGRLVTRTTGSTPSTPSDEPQSGRREPRVTDPESPTRTNEPQSGRREPRLTDPDMDMRADVKPNTPSTGGLSAAEQRRLSRTGSMTRNNTVYTRADIARRDAEIIARGGDPTRPPLQQFANDDQAASRNRNPGAPSGLMKIPGAKIVVGLLKWVRIIFGTQVATALQTVINVAALEDALDAYWRAVEDYGNGLDQAGKRELAEALKSESPIDLPGPVRSAYVDALERVTETLIEGLVSLMLGAGGTALAVFILGATGIATGGVGFIVALIAGGALAIFGTPVLYDVLESMGFNDWLERALGSTYFTPKMLLGIGMQVDGWQEQLGALLDNQNDTAYWGWMIPDAAGDMVRDSIQYESDEENSGVPQLDSAKAIAAIKAFIKSDPKLIQAFNDGKEEAKEIIKSNS